MWALGFLILSIVIGVNYGWIAGLSIYLLFGWVEFMIKYKKSVTEIRGRLDRVESQMKELIDRG